MVGGGAIRLNFQKPNFHESSAQRDVERGLACTYSGSLCIWEQSLKNSKLLPGYQLPDKALQTHTHCTPTNSE